MTCEVPVGVPLTEAVPLDAPLEILQVIVSPVSASVACNVKLNAVGEPSSSMVTDVEAPSVITGPLLVIWV